MARTSHSSGPAIPMITYLSKASSPCSDDPRASVLSGQVPLLKEYVIVTCAFAQVRFGVYYDRKSITRITFGSIMKYLICYQLMLSCRRLLFLGWPRLHAIALTDLLMASYLGSYEIKHGVSSQ